MKSLLVPFLIVVVAPALYLAHRLAQRFEALRRRVVRRASWSVLFALLLLSLPWGGVDLATGKRIALLLAAAAVALVLVEDRATALLPDRRRWMAALALLAALSLLNFLNYFSFHGERTFLHLHDAAHYYLGAKYFRELGYSDLYVGMLRAEAEITGDRFMTIEARDLDSYRLVHVAELLRRSDEVKARFSPGRWRDFRRDVTLFREALGRLYAEVLRDHGFNPTPVWVLFGSPLANLVPAGSRTGILLLCLLDPLLLVVLFGAVGRVFGERTALVSLTYFCLVFGAGFAWTGGAFLRYAWLGALVLGACALELRRPALAGGLLALAAGLRVFPVLFVAPLLFAAVGEAVESRRIPTRTRQLFGCFVATGGILFGATLVAGETEDWVAFTRKLSRHVDVLAPNVVGLTPALAYRPGPDQVTAAELERIEARRRTIHRTQLFTLLPATAVVVFLLARRRSALHALTLGVPLILSSLSLASYYYTFLVLLTLAHRASRRRLALIFGVEVASYLLLLFEDREALLYNYRSLLLVPLLVALEIDTELESRLAIRTTGRATTGSGTAE